MFRGGIIAAGTPDELKALVAGPANANPTMEDAFIALVQQHSTDGGAA